MDDVYKPKGRETGEGLNPPNIKSNVIQNEYDKEINKMAQTENLEFVFKNEHQLYEQARARVKNKTNYKFITDEDIIIDQEKEIKYYRERIENLTRIVNQLHETNMQWQTLSVTGNEDSTIEQIVDSITETYYANGEIIKEVTTYYK